MEVSNERCPTCGSDHSYRKHIAQVGEHRGPCTDAFHDTPAFYGKSIMEQALEEDTPASEPNLEDEIERLRGALAAAKWLYDAIRARGDKDET